MFDLIAGTANHIPAKPGLPLVISTAIQITLVGAVLVPVLLFTGAIPEPPTMMAFVAAPAPPPPPPPPPPPAAAREPARTARTVPATERSAAPVEAPHSIDPELSPVVAEEGVPGGVEGGVPGGVIGGVTGGVIGGLPDAPPPPPPPATPAPVRVGGQIKQPALIKRVEPFYPPLAVQAHIEGTVILEAIVSAQGRVENVTVLRSAGVLLDNAALGAVKQWQYSPVVLNGIPTPFILSVVLSFNLEAPK